MKFVLKRIKSENQNSPDYKGFFRTPRGDFYVVGYLKKLSSDMDLNIIIIDDDLLKNKFILKDYLEWRQTQKN
jgi:hypothetical protein